MRMTLSMWWIPERTPPFDFFLGTVELLGQGGKEGFIDEAALAGSETPVTQVKVREEFPPGCP